MKNSSFFVAVSALIFLGAGCASVRDRFPESQEKQKTSDVATSTPPLTKETINLRDAELFLRTRDDVAPGQEQVTAQRLYAKTKDGQIVEIVDDVRAHIHADVGVELGEAQYLVQQAQAMNERYAYFVDTVADAPPFSLQHLFAFDKDTKRFVNLPITRVQEAADAPLQFSTDGAHVAVIAQFPSQKTPTVYIGNLASGAVTHAFFVGPQYTIFDASRVTTTTGEEFLPPPGVETKWADDHLFQVEMFGVKDRKGKPVDVATIDTTLKYDADASGTTFIFDETLDTVFAHHGDVDGWVAVAGTRWTHPAHGFSFQVPEGLVMRMGKGGDYYQLVSASSTERATVVVQPGIPGVPLPPQKIEKVILDGVKCNLYHDRDQAEGAPLDKLVCDFPDKKNAVYIGSGEHPGAPMLNLKSIIASWKWKK